MVRMPPPQTFSKNKKAHIVESKEVAQESPYVHRYTAYLADLKKSNWAYENSKRMPRARYGS